MGRPKPTLVSSNLSKNVSDSVFSSSDTVQVLALDGGGLKGLYTASVIKALEDELGHSLVRHFDIITGTSTGGLIALAMGLKKSGLEIQQFYLDEGPSIFPSRGISGFLRKIRQFFVSKYSKDTLERTLKDLLSDSSGVQRSLSDSCRRLIIPSYLGNGSRPCLIKTPHAERYKYDGQLPMWVVGLAATAAPTYFPSFDNDGDTYVDGGIWANNPSLVGVIEALDLGASLEHIRVLNIGTTISSKSSVFYKQFGEGGLVRRSGVAAWGWNILDVLMDASSFATSNMYMHQLLGKGNSFTVNNLVDDGRFSIDKVDMSSLVNLGEAAGSEAFSDLSNMFLHNASSYTPQQGKGGTC